MSQRGKTRARSSKALTLTKASRSADDSEKIVLAESESSPEPVEPLMPMDSSSFDDELDGTLPLKLQRQLQRSRISLASLQFYLDQELREAGYTQSDLLCIRAFRLAQWGTPCTGVAQSSEEASSSSVIQRRIPSDLPTFQVDATLQGADPRGFIDSLVTRLQAEDVAPSRWSTALQVALLRGEAARWARLNILPTMSWDTAKTLFLSFFADANQQERDTQELFKLTQVSTVAEFGADEVYGSSPNRSRHSYSVQGWAE